MEEPWNFQAEIVFSTEMQRANGWCFIDLSDKFSFGNVQVRFEDNGVLCGITLRGQEEMFKVSKFSSDTYFVLFIGEYQGNYEAELLLECNSYYVGWGDSLFSFPTIHSLSSISSCFRNYPDVWDIGSDLFLSSFKCNHGFRFPKLAFGDSSRSDRITSLVWFEDHLYLTKLECNKVIEWRPGSDWVGVIETRLKIKFKPYIVKVARINSKETIFMRLREQIKSTFEITLHGWKKRLDGTHRATIKKRELIHQDRGWSLSQVVLSSVSYMKNKLRKSMGLSYIDLDQRRIWHPLVDPKKDALDKEHGAIVEDYADALNKFCLSAVGARLPRGVVLEIIRWI